jgi:hypothetical protein
MKQVFIGEMPRIPELSPDEREARLVERRRERLAAVATGHLCTSRSAAGDRELKPGHSTACPACETEIAREAGLKENE